MIKDERPILVIDDNTEQQLIYKKVLNKEGFTNLSEFSSADDFFNSLNKLKKSDKPFPEYDLILLDINMPGTDGIEACKKLKTLEKYKDTPIIILTGMIDDLTMTEAFNAGAHDYIKLPFSKIELLSRVKAALRLKREIDEKKFILEEKDELLSDLKDALENIKTLTGLIPICANCKNIRGDDGYWDQVEVYITKHSQAVFTHGICPSCAEKLYKEARDLKLKSK